MMWNPILIWSLKAGLLLSLLYGVYFFLFRNNTQFHLKRVLLLSVLAATLLWPVIKFSASEKPVSTTQVFQKLDESLISPVAEIVPKSIEASEALVTETSSVNSTSDIIWWVYLTGVAISLLVFFSELVKLTYWRLTGTEMRDLGKNVISHPSVKYPFSFWKWIFIPESVDYSESEWTVIQEHENLHLKQKHTVDILCAALAQCALWYHPAIYLFQKGMKSNHEALADSAVLKSTNFGRYTEILLALSLRTSSVTLGHSFALISSLSKRLKVMKLKKTSKRSSYASIISFAVLALVIASQTVSYGQSQSNNESQALKISDLWVASGGQGSQPHYGKEIVEKSGKSPDTWVSLKPQYFIFPVVFLGKHQKLIDTFLTSIQNENPDNEVRLQIAMNTEKALKFENVYEHYEPAPNRSELNIELTVEDRLAMFELTKAWVKENVHQVYPDYPMPSEMQFVANKYLVVRPYTFNPADTVGSKKDVVVANAITREAQPVGGLDRFLKNVVTDVKGTESLKKEDLPDKIEFKFQVSRTGYISQLSLESKVKQNRHEDDVYALLRQLHDNIIAVSNLYSWDPSLEKGKEVSSWVTIEIPKSIL
ncbi:M56 family metallopeptidase [uncultured Roseivirga sp.]|uniref:M56 family metallopeptidase n=1 Tax=uncultured Roseivirga sp. TaxID=543088 RepID=UPI0030DADD93